MDDILRVAVKAARDAGVFLRDNFGKITSIESKGDRNFATNLDKEAEKMIVDEVIANFPDHGVIGEEGGAQGKERDYLWIIDPLDGTHNYMRNINVFGVSIGIVHKQEFIAGVVYMPADDELYTAARGQGAYKNGKKIAVSSVDKLVDCSISFDSSIRYSPDVMLAVLGDLSREVFNIRMTGSSARQLTYVAEGKLDCSVEFHDSPWDFAGSVCLIEEAGGKIHGLKGEPLTYSSVGYIASNKKLHAKIEKIVHARL